MRHALFDVRNDPKEERDLAGRDTPTSHDLERRLDEANSSFRAAAESETQPLPPEVVERLKALGYL